MITVPDYSSLSHKIVDNRLVICRAIQYRGNYYDISVGLEGQNFNSNIPSNLPARIQVLVAECLKALQTQLATDSTKKVERLDQIGFSVQKPAADQPYATHMIVAGVGQSALDQMKNNHANLSSLYYGNTSELVLKNVAPTFQQAFTPPPTTVHEGLVQLCNEFSGDLQVFAFAPSQPQVSDVPKRPDPSTPDLLSPPKSKTPPPAESLAQPTETKPASPPVPEPAIDQAQPPLKKQTTDDENVEDAIETLEASYKRWQQNNAKRFCLGGWLRALPLWSKISLRQLAGLDPIDNEQDRASVKQAFQRDDQKLNELFTEFTQLETAQNYYRTDFVAKKTSDEAALDKEDEQKFYENYITERFIKPMKDHWANSSS